MALATGGMFSAINKKSFEHLCCFSFIASTPYRLLLRTVNLNAKFSPGTDSTASIYHLYDKMDAKLEKLTKYGISLRDSKKFNNKHVASRLSLALRGVAATVVWVAKGVIGAIAIPLSFLTLGKFTTVNYIADESLQMPLIICGLFCTTLLTINPWAFDQYIV